MQRRTLIAALPAALAWPAARAQTFPARQIRYIVPVAAGGGSDLVGRTVTERWGRLLNQTFIVENIGGGGGAIACQTTAKAAPDGYTLLLANVGQATPFTLGVEFPKAAPGDALYYSVYRADRLVHQGQFALRDLGNTAAIDVPDNTSTDLLATDGPYTVRATPIAR